MKPFKFDPNQEDKTSFVSVVCSLVFAGIVVLGIFARVACCLAARRRDPPEHFRARMARYWRMTWFYTWTRRADPDVNNNIPLANLNQNGTQLNGPQARVVVLPASVAPIAPQAPSPAPIWPETHYQDAATQGRRYSNQRTHNGSWRQASRSRATREGRNNEQGGANWRGGQQQAPLSAISGRTNLAIGTINVIGSSGAGVYIKMR